MVALATWDRAKNDNSTNADPSEKPQRFTQPFDVLYLNQSAPITTDVGS